MTYASHGIGQFALRLEISPHQHLCEQTLKEGKETDQNQKRGNNRQRRFDKIFGELESAFRVHEEMGSYLGGVHLELTGENVTECTGGARGLNDSDLARAYKSTVDPRLNYDQAMEIAMRIAGLRKKNS